jgi:hypothetical protein
VLREERSRGEAAPSLGPCPRLVSVGLAEIEEGPAPRRVRLLQYAVAGQVPEADLERVQANALRRTSVLVDVYREAIAAWPALAEPVQIIHVAGLEDGFAVDAIGEPIPFAREDDPGAAAVLEQACRAGDVDWVAGRVVDLEGSVRLAPCSFARRGRVVRLR